jgi:hypothetical protein
MLTPEQAKELVDPTLSEEAQIQSAQVLIASSAAYDAYLDSRPQLEQIIARANGGGVIPSHEELNNPAAEAKAAAEAGQEQGAAGAGSEQAALTGTVVEESPAEQELKAARERVAQLESEAGRE